MISIETAIRLRDGGVRWDPAVGDRFVVTTEGVDDVFVLSDMTIEVQRRPDGDIIGFNGTTEWALDSVDQAETLWLPRETQLRELLGGTFRALRSDTDGYAVDLIVNGVSTTITDPDAEEALGLALLSLLDN